jgi:hypothetical protein
MLPLFIPVFRTPGRRRVADAHHQDHKKCESRGTDSVGEVDVYPHRMIVSVVWYGRLGPLCVGGTVLRPVDVPEIPAETAALARKVHPRGTDEMRVRDALGPLFHDEDFTTGQLEDMYSSLGQPGLSPALLLMVTILQFRHNLSDCDAAQALADRISWKYCLVRREAPLLREGVEEPLRWPVAAGWRS